MRLERGCRDWPVALRDTLSDARIIRSFGVDYQGFACGFDGMV